MKKKILILNGSPRKNGNTDFLVESFTNGAESSGHHVDNVRVCDMNIHACKGCLQGGKDKKSPCTQKDDMDQIYEKYVDADIVVFASPMYCWSITAQLKAVLDRLFAVTEANNYVNPYKECILLMPAEGDTEDNFQPVTAYFESLLKHMGWKNLGILYVPGVLHIGDIKGNPLLEDAHNLGKSLYQ